MLVLSLAISFITGGAVSVKNAYQNVTLRSDAQLLLSTAITSVSDELRYASDVTDDGSTISFQSSTRKAKIKLENKDNNIYVVALKSDGTEAGEIPLITDKTNSNGLGIKIDSLKYERDVFECILKITHNGTEDIYEGQTIYVRPVDAP